MKSFIEHKNTKTVFLDMDGVLADFVDAFNKKFKDKFTLDAAIKNKKFWNSTKSSLFSTDFFLTLKPMSGIKLIQDAIDLGFNVEILTSVGKFNTEHVIKLKKQWLNRHVKQNLKFNYSLSSTAKSKFANKNTILIDDRLKSIEPFKSKGGQGILYKNYNDAKTQLNKIANEGVISESLITFNKKAYPPGNNVVILSGGAGSGKGFTIKNLLGIDGKFFNVDDLKEILSRRPKLAKLVKAAGLDPSKMSLKNDEDVAKLHQIFKDLKIDQKLTNLFIGAISKNKPNIIFDVTLAKANKLDKLKTLVLDAGYDSKNIHIVWVLNDINIAMLQNKARTRHVKDNILLDTHIGAANNMKDIINNNKVDGDIWISFNLINIDTKLEKSKFGGKYISKANLLKIKSSGKPALKIENIKNEMLNKIKNYTPSEVVF